MREYLRPDKVEAMLQAARKTGRHGARDGAIIRMLLHHGLRTAELVALLIPAVSSGSGCAPMLLVPPPQP